MSLSLRNFCELKRTRERKTRPSFDINRKVAGFLLTNFIIGKILYVLLCVGGVEALLAELNRKETAERSLVTYERQFKEIGRLTGEYDLGKLVQRFIQAETKNYGLFTYIAELNNEVERLEEQKNEVIAAKNNPSALIRLFWVLNALCPEFYRR
jgi:hypothetical protein